MRLQAHFAERQVRSSWKSARTSRHRAAFTMVEIAICLAIIGFALVAIIGVLPSGMRVQKENREETIINQDATFWMEAIRGGAKGTDLLTNYVEYIAVSSATLSSAGIPGPVTTVVYANSLVAPSITPPTGSVPNKPLTNGFQIVNLLATPRYELLPSSGYRSNYVFAYVKAISGPAADKGRNAPSRDFAFRYRLVPEVISADWTALQNFNWNVQGLSAQQRQELTNKWWVLRNTSANLQDVRLLFRWPVLPGPGQVAGEPRIGNGRQAFRTLVSGSFEPNVGFVPSVFREVAKP